MSTLLDSHLEVDRQLPDSILPPQRAPVKDIYDGALKERLDIVYVAVDVLRGMVTTIAPTLFLGSTFGIANNENTSSERKREGGGAMSTTHVNQQKANANGARHLFDSFLNDGKRPG